MLFCKLLCSLGKFRRVKPFLEIENRKSYTVLETLLALWISWDFFDEKIFFFDNLSLTEISILSITFSSGMEETTN